MSTFVITICFSGVIPLLNIVSAMSFFILYFSDKILLFKFYQTPINYTQTLHRVLAKVIVLALLGHFVITSFCLSESTISLSNLSLLQGVYSFNSGNKRLNTIFTTPHIIPYPLLFIGLVLFIFLKSFIVDSFANIYKAIKEKLFEVQ